MTTTARPRRPRAGLLGALALATDTADEIVLGTVRDVHGAVARRVLRRHRPGDRRLVAAGPRPSTSGCPRPVYAGVGAGLRATSRGLRAADRRGVGARIEDTPRRPAPGLGRQRPDRGPAGRAAVRAGDHAGRAPPRPRRAARRRRPLAEAFPAATPDLVVFLHGLGEADDAWDRRARRDRRQLRQAAGRGRAAWTPGLPAGEHRPADRRERRRAGLAARRPGGRLAHRRTPDRAGRALDGRADHARRLRGRHRRRPAVEHAGDRRRHARHAAPRGAPGARRRPRAPGRWAGCPSRRRSAGSWSTARSASSTCAAGLAPDVQNLPHARYHLVAATLAGSPPAPGQRGPRRPAGALPARRPAGPGAARRCSPGADVLHIQGDHFDLLNHPRVYDALRTWLADPHDRPAAATAAEERRVPSPCR